MMVYFESYSIITNISILTLMAINGHEKVVSVDRLKPAFVEHTATATVTDTPASQSQTPTAAISPPKTDLLQQITRSGCHIHWPKWSASYK